MLLDCAGCHGSGGFVGQQILMHHSGYHVALEETAA
jgi:hypothetical protein